MVSFYCPLISRQPKGGGSTSELVYAFDIRALITQSLKVALAITLCDQLSRSFGSQEAIFLFIFVLFFKIQISCLSHFPMISQQPKGGDLIF